MFKSCQISELLSFVKSLSLSNNESNDELAVEIIALEDRVLYNASPLAGIMSDLAAVSYTHLTLPTIYSV